MESMTSKAHGHPHFDWRRPHHWIAFGFGAGLAPWAPGTVGTLVAIPLYLALVLLPPLIYLLALALLILVGLWACGKTAAEVGGGDPSAIVWDEILGFLLTMALVPPLWYWLLLGFLLFRFFDIVKPWPIAAVDLRVKGGLGIVLDDLVAGALAWVLMQVVLNLTPSIFHFG